MEVYDTLAIALPIMGLLAFGCAQVLAVLILRRRFIPPQATTPLQRRLQVGLYVVLFLCASLWGYVFWICAQAVMREMMRGNWLPLPLFVGALIIAFTALVTVSWFAIRHRVKSLERLSSELQTLSGRSMSVSEGVQLASRSATQERPLTEKARHAVLFLGASSYQTTLERLQATSPLTPGCDSGEEATGPRSM